MFSMVFINFYLEYNSVQYFEMKKGMERTIQKLNRSRVLLVKHNVDNVSTQYYCIHAKEAQPKLIIRFMSNEANQIKLIKSERNIIASKI